MPQYELNLRDYVRIFRRRKTAIILTFMLVVITSIIFSRQADPTYEAITTVKIEERQTVAGLLTEWIVYSPGDVMESEAKIIRGHKIIKKTALSMGKITDDSSEDKVNKVVSDMAAMIETEQIGATNIISIIVTTSSTQESIVMANTIADIYIKENLLNKTKQARSARLFIEEQLASLDERLKEKEDLMQKVSEESKSVIMSEPMHEKLVELQFTLTNMLQKYTERHPNVIQIQEQISEIEKQIKASSGEDLYYARLLREVEADRKLYSLLKEKLEEARITEAQKVGDISIVNPAVTAKKNIGPNKKFSILISAILGLVLGVALALTMESLDTSIATIEDVEGIIKVQVLGVIPSVTFGDDLNKKGNFLTGIQKRFMHVNKTEEEERYVRLLTHFNPTSLVAEAYRNIYTNLKIDQTKKTMLITSAGPREGKSTILTNLSLAIAQTGTKVLMISSDIRRPILAKSLGIKREPGLTEVLLGMIPLEEGIKNITDFMLGSMSFKEVRQTPGLDNLYLMPSGQLPFNPAKVLESKELDDLIVKLKEQFDIVIFDSPPVLPVTDASILSAKMDMVVMAYEIGRTSRDALLRAKTQLDSVGAKIKGVILNQTRNETDVDVLYPYYYKYRYYREEKKPPKKKEMVKA